MSQVDHGLRRGDRRERAAEAARPEATARADHRHHREQPGPDDRRGRGQGQVAGGGAVGDQRGAERAAGDPQPANGERVRDRQPSHEGVSSPVGVCDHREVRSPLRLIVAACFMALAVALTALAAGGASHLGHSGPSAGATTDLERLWAVPPVEVAAILIVAALYFGRARRSGVVTGWRQASFAAGIAVLLIAVCSPLGGVAQQGLLTAHMLQHTLIGAVAPLLLLLGMPRRVRRAAGLAGLAEPPAAGGRTRSSPSRRGPWGYHRLAAVRPCTTPCWRAPPLWILQQASFLVLGLILWAPVDREPFRLRTGSRPGGRAPT